MNGGLGKKAWNLDLEYGPDQGTFRGGQGLNFNPEPSLEPNQKLKIQYFNRDLSPQVRFFGTCAAARDRYHECAEVDSLIPFGGQPPTIDSPASLFHELPQSYLVSFISILQPI